MSTNSSTELLAPSEAELQSLALKKETDMSGNEYEQARDVWLRDRLCEHRREFTTYCQIGVFCGTWNVNNQISETEDLTKWLRCSATEPDIYALGFQELDMSTKNYLSSSCSDRQNKWLELCRRALPPEGNYVELKVVKLFSTCLIVLVKHELLDSITELRWGTHATGIMGFGANKGGTAMRFQLKDTLLTFVNCHLGAGEDKVERRYEDCKDIQQKLKMNFDVLGHETEFLNVDVENHAIFWFGDLNFRLAHIGRDEAEKRISSGQLKELLAVNDELNLIRAKDKSFSRFADLLEGFQEAEIKFKPTYKFEVGSDHYELEKLRVPSWCDRILWHTNLVDCQPIKYDCFLGNQMSDHKPVACIFELHAAQVNEEQRGRVYKKLIRHIDRMENAILPQCVIEPNHEIYFGEVSFFESYQAAVSLRNVGQVTAKWSFQGIEAFDGDIAPSFIRVTPNTSKISVDSSQSIVLKLSLKDRHVAEALRRWSENDGKNSVFRQPDILVIALVGGKHFFLIPYADLVPTCFGLPLACACRARHPIGATDREQLRCAVRLAYQGDMSGYAELKDFLSAPNPLPKELLRLVNHLRQWHLETPYLLQDAVSTDEIVKLTDFLCNSSASTPLPEYINGQSYLQTLFLYLECLPDQLLPEPDSSLGTKLLNLVFDLSQELLSKSERNGVGRDDLYVQLARVLYKGSSPNAKAPPNIEEQVMARIKRELSNPAALPRFNY